MTTTSSVRSQLNCRFKLFIHFGMWCGLFGPQANEDRRTLTLLTEGGHLAGSQLIQRSGRTVDNLMYHSLRAMVRPGFPRAMCMQCDLSIKKAGQVHKQCCMVRLNSTSC